MAGYRVPDRTTPVDLILDANEGPLSVGQLTLDGFSLEAESLRRYPDESVLESIIARRFGLDASWCMVTPGTDAALSRLLTAYTGPERGLVVPTPTFAMIPIYARFTAAQTARPGWPAGEFPLHDTLEQIDGDTGCVVIVSPNNPTGAVAPRDVVWRVAERCAEHGALLLVDAAYIEFADNDPTSDLLGAFPGHTVVSRTLSKAWGLAGARVGYALGNPALLEPARVIGGPYTVPGPSLAIAANTLDVAEPVMRSAVGRVRTNRGRLEETLSSLGAGVVRSQSNGVFARFGSPAAADLVRTTCAGLGIAVRGFSGELAEAIRITVPDDNQSTDRVEHAVRTALAPEALLLDIDGVVADVSTSYRRCIIETARSFGATITESDVAQAKRAGDANNDWVLTRRLIVEMSGNTVAPTLAEITDRFETLYHGVPGKPGLKDNERLIGDVETLRRLALLCPLAAVTGRPRRDAAYFLEAQGVAKLFTAVICMEDTPHPKPDPAPVRAALEALAVGRGWMVGDTPDDARAARAAGVCPIGMVAPGEDPAVSAPVLRRAGAGRVITGLGQLIADLEGLPAVQEARVIS